MSLLPMTSERRIQVSQSLRVVWGSWVEPEIRKLTLHDVVAVGDEADADDGGGSTQLPERDFGLGGTGASGGPSSVHASPDTDGVADIVGTVGERSSAGSDDLDVRVEMLNLVGVLGGVAVDALHAAAFGGVVDADLGSVDVIVGTVEEGNNDLGGDALEEGDKVVDLVEGASAELVTVEGTHGPAKRAASLAEVGVVALLGVLQELLVLSVGVLPLGGTLLLVVRGIGGDRGNVDLGLELGGAGVRVRATLLDDGIVGHVGLQVLKVGRGGALEEEGALEDHPPLERGVLLDDLGVHEGDEEEAGEEEEAEADAEADGGDVPRGLVVEAEVRGALVDDREGADGAGDQEEEGRGVDSPRDGVLAHMDRELDEHEDDGGEAA